MKCGLGVLLALHCYSVIYGAWAWRCVVCLHVVCLARVQGDTLWVFFLPSNSVPIFPLWPPILCPIFAIISSSVTPTCGFFFEVLSPLPIPFVWYAHLWQFLLMFVLKFLLCERTGIVSELSWLPVFLTEINKCVDDDYGKKIRERSTLAFISVLRDAAEACWWLAAQTGIVSFLSHRRRWESSHTALLADGLFIFQTGQNGKD